MLDPFAQTTPITVPASDRPVTLTDNQPPVEPETGDIRSLAERLRDDAIETASHEDKAIGTLALKLADMKTELVTGPLSIAVMLAGSIADIMSKPRPGTEDGPNPDKFKIGKVVDGVHKSVSTSYWRIYADNTPEGKQLLAHEALLKKLKAGNLSELPEDIKKLAGDDSAIKKAVDKNAHRIAYIRSLYPRSAGLYFRIRDIAALPGVLIDIVKDDNGQVEKTKAPFWLRNKADQSKQSFQSITNILRMDVADAAKRGGTYKALIDTLDREVQHPVKWPKLDGTPALLGYLLHTHRYTDTLVNDESKANEYKAFIKVLASAGSDDALTTVGDLRNFFDAVLKTGNFRSRYDIIVSNRDKARDAA